MFSTVSMSSPSTSAYSASKPAETMGTVAMTNPSASVFSTETAGSVACSSSSFSVMA